MRKTFLFTVAVLMFGLFNSQAQQRTTKETKIVVVVDEETNYITAMELFDAMAKHDKQSIHKTYPSSKFYVGLLKGGYKVIDRGIVPALNTTITMFTTKEYFPVVQAFPGYQFVPGDQFDIGSIKAEVVSSKDGELIIKTE